MIEIKQKDKKQIQMTKIINIAIVISTLYLVTNGQSNCFSEECTSCSNPLSCEACSLVNKSACCPPNCQQCFTNNGLTCLTCDQGFILNKTLNICIQKNSCNQSSCASCITSYSNSSNPINICQSCNQPSTGLPNVYLNVRVNACLACTIANCLKCSPSGLSCIQCISGYAYVQAQCINTIANNVIVSCATNQFYQSKYVCQTCSQTIANCNSCGINAFNFTNIECTQCANGYFLRDGQCLSCPVGCQTCATQIGCIQCISGFSSPINYNGKCQACFANCTSCPNNSTICEKCSSGWTVSTNGTCFECGSNEQTKNCQKCFSNMTCYQCSIGYKTNSQEVCRRSGYFGLPVWVVCLIGLIVLLVAASLLTLLLWFVNKKQRENGLSETMFEDGGSVVDQYHKIVGQD